MELGRRSMRRGGEGGQDGTVQYRGTTRPPSSFKHGRTVQYCSVPLSGGTNRPSLHQRRRRICQHVVVVTDGQPSGQQAQHQEGLQGSGGGGGAGG